MQSKSGGTVITDGNQTFYLISKYLENLWFPMAMKEMTGENLNKLLDLDFLLDVVFCGAISNQSLTCNRRLQFVD